MNVFNIKINTSPQLPKTTFVKLLFKKSESKMMSENRLNNWRPLRDKAFLFLLEQKQDFKSKRQSIVSENAIIYAVFFLMPLEMPFSIINSMK